MFNGNDHEDVAKKRIHFLILVKTNIYFNVEIFMRKLNIFLMFSLS